jgi:ArsR family transcriptional regulator
LDTEINPWEQYTNVFKSLSDTTRLKIMWLLLSIDSKISVSEIIYVLGENQYNVSKHLRILKTADLIYEKKDGKWTFYHYRTKDDDFDVQIRKTVMAIPKEMIAGEILRCKERLSMRVDGKCVIGTKGNE